MESDFTLWHLLGGLLIAAVGFVIYFIPALVANGKHQQRAILWLNLLAGWTLIGWVGALIWAISTPKYTQRPLPTTASPSRADELAKLARLHEEGQLTDAEFTQAKARLL